MNSTAIVTSLVLIGEIEFHLFLRTAAQTLVLAAEYITGLY